MSKERLIPSTYLYARELDFLEAWRVSRHGIYVPPVHDKPDVFVWSGRFVDSETITFVVGAKDKLGYDDGAIFVGVVSEEEREQALSAGKSVIEAHAEAAQTRTIGLHGALGALMLLKGLPGGERMMDEDLLDYNMEEFAC